MFAGLLKRAGLAVFAIVFLAGGMPHFAAAGGAQATSSLSMPHTPGMDAAPGGAHRHGHQTSGQQAPACQPTDDCLFCVVFDVPASNRIEAAPTWVVVAFVPNLSSLNGLIPSPEIFPPISQP
jgi:hypothetical protein